MNRTPAQTRNLAALLGFVHAYNPKVADALADTVGGFASNPDYAFNARRQNPKPPKYLRAYSRALKHRVIINIPALMAQAREEAEDE